MKINDFALKTYFRIKKAGNLLNILQKKETQKYSKTISIVPIKGELLALQGELKGKFYLCLIKSH